MKTFAATAAITLSLALMQAGDASAQYRPGYPGGYPGGYGGRPTVSPYLNLLGRGNPAINYYGIVRPQMAFENALYGGTGAGPLLPGEELTDPELRRATGHSVAFNNLSHFYNNNPATGGGQGSAARFNTGAGGVGAAGGSGPGRISGNGGARGAPAPAGGGFGASIH